MKIQVMLIATAVMCWSCTVNFLEYNKDPYGVSDEVLASGGIAEKLANDCAVLSTVVIPLQDSSTSIQDSLNILLLTSSRFRG